MSLLAADSVTRWRATTTTDKYGNTVTTWDPDKGKVTYSGVSVQPDYSTETTGDRSSRVTGLRLITPQGKDVDILATDRVLFAGVAYEVDGEVGRFRIGGRVHHVEARLILFAG
jgi:hypothetical protein